MQSRILVIGEVYTDYHIDSDSVRLGGIFHSVRTLAALSACYSAAYWAPSYIQKSIEKYLNIFDVNYSEKIGDVLNCPNVILVKDSTETGNQGYNDILRGQCELTFNESLLRKVITTFNPTDLLIYPGKFDLKSVINTLSDYNFRIHIDFQYDSNSIDYVVENTTVSTLIFSTSSKFFTEKCKGISNTLFRYFSDNKIESILLKENRGGSRLYNINKNILYECPCFPTDTVHSVGVGDCFNATFINMLSLDDDLEYCMRFASYIASFYASTFDYDDYLSLVKVAYKIDKASILRLTGITLPWEARKDVNIYIAGPDFPGIDTTYINLINDCLIYHNFNPHLPIKENGLITGNETEIEVNTIYYRDIQLLEQADILVAVLLYNDPGTLVELGYFAKSGKPTVLFDPYKIAKNMFLIKTSTLIVDNLTDLIDTIYKYSSYKEE